MLRHLPDNEASGGLVLMGAAALALVVAISTLAPTYSAALHAYLGPLSIEHWINDGLMAIFFLLVGLEIKREILESRKHMFHDHYASDRALDQISCSIADTVGEFGAAVGSE
jgi:Na+/H+ antiporter NhaA